MRSITSRPLLSAMLLTVALVLGGCAQDNDRATTLPPVEQTPAAVAEGAAPVGALSQADLEAALLTVQDMPAGFTEDTSPEDEGGPSSGCEQLQEIQKPDSQVAAAAQFTKGGFGPFVTQDLSLLTEEQASRSMDALATILEACRTLKTTTEDGQTMTVTLSAMSFPKLGDDTFAIKVSGDGGIVSISGDMVVIRRGRILMLISNISIGSSDTAITEQVARSALDKLDATL